LAQNFTKGINKMFRIMQLSDLHISNNTTTEGVDNKAGISGIQDENREDTILER
jgi:predicted MPP superfamily phosphohydrolase